VTDYFTPNFSYTALTPGRIAATREAANIMITDIGSGVPISGINNRASGTATRQRTVHGQA